MNEVLADPQSDVLNMALDKIDTLTAELTELANSTTSDHIAAKYWKQRQDARNETRRVEAERDALAAQIAATKQVVSYFADQIEPHVYGEISCELDDDLLNDDGGNVAHAALSEVKADAWDEGHRACDRDWSFTADLSTPDEDREPWKNPYRNELGGS